MFTAQKNSVRHPSDLKLTDTCPARVSPNARPRMARLFLDYLVYCRGITIFFYRRRRVSRYEDYGVPLVPSGPVPSPRKRRNETAKVITL